MTSTKKPMTAEEEEKARPQPLRYHYQEEIQEKEHIQAKASGTQSSGMRNTELAARLTKVLMLSHVSARALSKAANLGDAHVSLLIRRLQRDPDADVELGTLVAIADATGTSRSWLAFGRDDSLGKRLGDAPQWDEWAELAGERYPTLPMFALKAVKEFVLPRFPRHLDAAFVVELARAWGDANPDDVQEEEDERWAARPPKEEE